MRSHGHLDREAKPASLIWARAGDSARPALAATVRRVFAAAHGATIHHLHDVLLAVADDDGRRLGVIGATDAAPGSRLFLETYLDEPIEQALFAATGRRLERTDVSEVGNLAVVQPGTGACLVTILANYLHGLGRSWAVFTAGSSLRASLRRTGAQIVDLGPADGERLGAELADWGRYYAGDPHVVAVDLDGFCSALSAHRSLGPHLRALWSAAHVAGQARRRGRVSA